MTKTVEQVVIGLVEEFVDDWGLDDIEINKDTKIKADIGFDSSDTMQLFAAIAEHYDYVEFRFQELVVQDDKFVDDLTLGQVIVFVLKTLNSNTKNTQESNVA
ncbi:MAG: acyl carrier protein [Alphaproteobacteria bacterium CG11_big_fil_rev_8_21_14_0_20_39_49]|nr:MAG: acyl carrier protein [Alphaproteobacteria bacterium CG11_big_fil_rev_8_21_14_0_20_39_49]